MNQKSIWHLEFLLKEFKNQSRILSRTSDEYRTEEDLGMQGIGSGLSIANKNFKKHIDTLESIIKEINDGYMVEDVDLSGMESEESA